MLLSNFLLIKAKTIGVTKYQICETMFLNHNNK